MELITYEKLLSRCHSSVTCGLRYDQVNGKAVARCDVCSSGMEALHPAEPEIAKLLNSIDGQMITAARS